MAELPFTNRVCGADNCDAVTPMDMLAVVVDGVGFCSPDCARSSVKCGSEATVLLNDMQFRADRPAGVPNDAPVIVMDGDDTIAAIDECDALTGDTSFRV